MVSAYMSAKDSPQGRTIVVCVRVASSFQQQRQPVKLALIGGLAQQRRLEGQQCENVTASYISVLLGSAVV
jgi:hypothetical protein